MGNLTQNRIKIIAAIAMVIDHVGVEFFPQIELFRIIGRLSFPLFSFFIYEGYRYTHNKIQYFLKVFALGLVCIGAYYFYCGELYGNILITFSLSMIALYGVSVLKNRISGNGKDKAVGIVFLLGCMGSIYFICAKMYVDYGFLGVMLPVFAEISCKGKEAYRRWRTLAGFAVGLFLLAVQMGGVQYFSLFALPLLAAYNGERGTRPMKSFFYWFYPAHLAVIGAIAFVIG